MVNALQVNRKILLVQNHHTFIPSYRDFNGINHFERLNAMEAAHLQRGFSEIAQNLTTFPDGTVAVCRSFDNKPASQLTQIATPSDLSVLARGSP